MLQGKGACVREGYGAITQHYRCRRHRDVHGMLTLALAPRLPPHARYRPPEGLLISDIQLLWDQLEKAEHARELALRSEVIRQERLEQLAAKFDRKAVRRETWLEDNSKIVQVEDFGEDVAAVEASLRRHEAIDTDVMAHEERINALRDLSEALQAADYHGADDVQDREDAILRSWRLLQEMMAHRRVRLVAPKPHRCPYLAGLA